MKLTYWYAEHLARTFNYDSERYSIRARTRREALAMRAAEPDTFGPALKVTIEYQDGFDLLTYCTSEAWGYEEANARKEVQGQQGD